jgi:hypothetical protein
MTEGMETKDFERRSIERKGMLMEYAIDGGAMPAFDHEN